MQPDISIIVPSFNTRDILYNCLSSIFQTNSSVKYEVIVVDDCSLDGSVDMVRHNFPQVIALTNSHNSGFSATCNRGLAIAKGRYSLLLNSDTLVFPDTLDRLVAFADDHPEAGIIGCAHLDGTGRRVASYAHGFVAPRVATSNKPQRLKNGWVSGACMLIRQTSLAEVGRLDERFFFGAEDLDLCWRMIKFGWAVYYTPNAKIIHYGGKSSSEDYMAKLYKKSKIGNALLVAKHGNAFQKVAWLILLLLDVLPRLIASIGRPKEAIILLDTTRTCFRLLNT